jgi:hypothetical protein
MANVSTASAAPRDMEIVNSWVNGKLSSFPRQLHTYMSTVLNPTHQPHLALDRLLESPESIVQSIEVYNTQTSVILQDVRYRARDDYIMLRYKHISHPHPEDPALLMEFFGIFDRIFFFGSLTRLCYVEIVDALPGADGDCTVPLPLIWRLGRFIIRTKPKSTRRIRRF